jgi:hypothetical protein
MAATKSPLMGLGHIQHEIADLPLLFTGADDPIFCVELGDSENDGEPSSQLFHPGHGGIMRPLSCAKGDIDA